MRKHTFDRLENKWVKYYLCFRIRTVSNYPSFDGGRKRLHVWLCSEIPLSPCLHPRARPCPVPVRHSALPLPWLSCAVLMHVAVAVFGGGAAAATGMSVPAAAAAVRHVLAPRL